MKNRVKTVTVLTYYGRYDILVVEVIMNDKEKQHSKKKLKLRIVGGVLVAIGIVCAIIGFVDMGKAFDESRMPMFWLFFIAFPSIAVGSFLLVASAQREINRYIKNENVPVINEFGQEISPAVSSIAGAAKNAATEKPCPFCGALNDNDAKYCKSCGKTLSAVCPRCGATNDADAKFCNDCGSPLGGDDKA